MDLEFEIFSEAMEGIFKKISNKLEVQEGRLQVVSENMAKLKVEVVSNLVEKVTILEEEKQKRETNLSALQEDYEQRISNLKSVATSHQSFAEIQRTKAVEAYKEKNSLEFLLKRERNVLECQDVRHRIKEAGIEYTKYLQLISEKRKEVRMVSTDQLKMMGGNTSTITKFAFCEIYFHRQH